jgi:hypothetical protein
LVVEPEKKDARVMKRFVNIVWKATAGAALMAGLVAPAFAQAQQLPSYATPDAPAQGAPPAPPAPPPSYAAHEEQVAGRISAIPGKYDLEVRDARGFIDKIRLRDGTVINPTGVRLATGMSVTVFGVNRGQVFEANQIDTPYTISPGYAYAPYPAYYAYGAYPYPYYPYGYGPWGGIGIGIGIGWNGYFGGWRGYYGGWRGGYYGGWHGGGWHGWR